MVWAFVILIGASGAAGLALGPVISRRARLWILIGGSEAALLGGALIWLQIPGVTLSGGGGAPQFLGLALLATAAVLLPFWSGASWSGH